VLFFLNIYLLQIQLLERTGSRSSFRTKNLSEEQYCKDLDVVGIIGLEASTCAGKFSLRLRLYIVHFLALF